jgi:hypothetical protein
MITCQHEWIEQCQIKYRWESLPEGEHWEDAHYPTPECRNGTETVRLWSRDHAVHGVLQSEDCNHPCLHTFRTHTDRELISAHYPEYLDLYNKWRFKLSSMGGQVAGQQNVELGFFTPGHPNCILTFDSQSAAGTLGGTTSYTLGVGIFDKDKKEERRRLGIGEFSKETSAIRSKNAKEVAEYLLENGLGIFSPEGRDNSRKRGKEYAEQKTGLFAEENLGKGAQVCKEKGTGVWGIPVEVKQQNGKLTMAYKYIDPDHPELGAHAAPVLVRMQKRRGYPCSPGNRVRIE